MSIIELLIGLAITSIMIAGLILLLQQAMRINQVSKNITSFDMRFAVVQSLLEQDLSGIFQAVLASKEGTVFYAQRSESNTDFLSFITDNSVRAFLNMQLGNPVSRVARVVYKLIPDVGHAQSYKMVRQEILDLNLPLNLDAKETYEDAYALIDGIASCSMTFDYMNRKNDDVDKQSATNASDVGQKKSESIIKTVFEWDNTKEKKLPIVPYCIKIKLELWSDDYRQKKPMEMYFELPEADAIKLVYIVHPAPPAQIKNIQEQRNNTGVRPPQSPREFFGNPRQNSMIGRLHSKVADQRKG